MVVTIELMKSQFQNLAIVPMTNAAEELKFVLVMSTSIPKTTDIPPKSVYVATTEPDWDMRMVNPAPVGAILPFSVPSIPRTNRHDENDNWFVTEIHGCCLVYLKYAFPPRSGNDMLLT